MAINKTWVNKMKITEEFKQFAIKGNVVDMAIGIVIGAAFGTVVKSMVDNVITPPLGRILGGMDFSNMFINLSSGSYNSLAAAKQAGAATLNYGLFINSVISFCHRRVCTIHCRQDDEQAKACAGTG